MFMFRCCYIIEDINHNDEFVLLAEKTIKRISEGKNLKGSCFCKIHSIFIEQYCHIIQFYDMHKENK